MTAVWEIMSVTIWREDIYIHLYIHILLSFLLHLKMKIKQFKVFQVFPNCKPRCSYTKSSSILLITPLKRVFDDYRL